MKNFIRDLAIAVLTDIISKYVIIPLISGGIVGYFLEGLMDLNFWLNIVAGVIVAIIVFIVYEILKIERRGVKVDFLIPEKPIEDKVDWEWKIEEGTKLILKNTFSADYKDCYAYIAGLESNGVNYFPTVTEKTNKLKWANFSKSDTKLIRRNNHEVLDVAFYKIGERSLRLWLEGDVHPHLPMLERLWIKIVLSGTFKGISKDFEFSGYLITKWDFERNKIIDVRLEAKK